MSLVNRNNPKRKRNKFYLSPALYLLSLLSINVSAQVHQTNFEQITIDDGLSQSTITSIIQDDDGFLWFGTHDGLNRYDGYNFRVFKHDESNPHSIGNNWINAVDKDINGDLWIATVEGFNKYDKINESFICYNIEIPGLSYELTGNSVFSIHCDKIYKKNIIWLGTNYGLVRYDVEKRFYELFDLKQFAKTGYYIKSFAQENSGDLWIGLNDGTILKFEKKTNRIKNYFVENTYPENNGSKNTNQISVDDKGDVWLSSDKGLFKLNKNENVFKQVKYLGDLNITTFEAVAFYSDSDYLYLGTYFNFIIYDKKNNKVSVFKNDPLDSHSISPGTVLSIFQDKSRQLWLGMNGNGICRVSPYKNNFQLYSSQDGKLSIKSVRSFCEDLNGNIWIGGYKCLDKLNKATGQFFHYLQNINLQGRRVSPSVLSLFLDYDKPEEIMWIGTEGFGLLKLGIESGTVEQVRYLNDKSENYTNSAITALYDDRKGNIWIGSEKGLQIYNKALKTSIRFSNNENDPHSISPKQVNCIFEDCYGSIWIGTDFGGLNLFDKSTKKFTRFIYDRKNPGSISNNNVKVIYEDKHKNLWIGTHGGGLNKLDRDKKIFTRYSVKDGLANDVIYGILEDDNNNLWLSTNAGLCKFNYTHQNIRNYSVHEGLQSNEFNTNAYYKSRSGEMFFGGISGFNSFMPGRIVENKFVPPVVITNFYLLNENIPVGKRIKGNVILKKSPVQTDTIILAYDENIFSFEFAALDFTSSKHNAYKYILEGFDEKWINSGSRRIANYTNIDPGTYIFKVKGTNNDGVWNKNGDSITIIINPPFWATWWFRFFGVILFGFALYGLYEFRMIAERQRSEELEKEVEQRTEELRIANEMLRKDALMLEETNASKDKLFSIISHDLKNPFQALLGYTEWLLEDYQTFSDEEKRKIIYNICESSVNIYNLLVRLLEWSRLQTSRVKIEPVKIDLKTLVDSITKILHVSLEKKQITLVNEIDYNIFIYADENMLVSVLQNLITNAIKYSYENSLIIISTIANEEYVAVSVADSGVGIHEKYVTKLFKADAIRSTKGTNNEQGTGFGLLLCKELVEKNGGTIWVETEDGKGSIFKFTIPRALNNRSN
jgi:signal transduction histidine kinase/ligand-binding sensor domain-containing protein